MKRMKKLKKLGAMILCLVIFFNMTGLKAYAASVNKVFISIPSQKFSNTYHAYESSKEANNNEIVLYVKEDEFPVYATLYGANGTEKKFTFDTYGTKQIEDEDPGAGTAIAGCLTFIFLGPLWIPSPHVYATIKIVQPKAKAKASKVEDNTKEEEGKKESSKNHEVDLEPLINEIEKLSNYKGGAAYERHIKDYISGKWDGSIKNYNMPDVAYCESLLDRTYWWSGYNQLNGKLYNDVKVNIDYIGTLDVVATYSSYTFAVNYDTNTIEQWMLLDNLNSWNLQLDSGEKILLVSTIEEVDENKLQGYVITNDVDGNSHKYDLYSDNKVDKIF